MKLTLLSEKANVSRESAALMMQLYRQPFQVMTPEKVHELVEKELAWKSENVYTSSTKCDELVEATAEEWFDKSGLTLNVKAPSRKPREISEDMQNKYDFMKAVAIEHGIVIKSEDIRRSNLRMIIDNKPRSAKILEICQGDMMRVNGYRTSKADLDEFERMGCTYRISGLNNYIDIDSTYENIVNIIKFITQ